MVVEGKEIDEDRFWSYVSRSDGCWLWCGSRDGKEGYGRHRNRQAHRIAFALERGSIAEGLQLDHLYKNPLPGKSTAREDASGPQGCTNALHTGACVHARKYPYYETRTARMPDVQTRSG